MIGPPLPASAAGRYVLNASEVEEHHIRQHLVLEGGCITEAGTHAELLACGGRYATLFELQAGRYR